MPTRARRSKLPVIPHREGITLPPGRSAGGGLDQRGGYRIAAVTVAYGPQRLSGRAGHRVQAIPAHTLAGEITVTACSLVPSPLGRDAAGAIDQAVPLQCSSSARNGAQQFGCPCRAKPATQALPAPATATPSSWLKSDCFTSELATAVSPAWASEMVAANDRAVAASAAVPRNFFMPATTGVPARRFTRHRCGTDLPMACSRPRPMGWPGLSAPAPKDQAPVSRPCTCPTDHPDLR